MFCTQSVCAAGCLKTFARFCIPSSTGSQCREASPSPFLSSGIWGKQHQTLPATKRSMKTEAPGGGGGFFFLDPNPSLPAAAQPCFGHQKDWKVTQRPPTPIPARQEAWGGSLGTEGSRGSGELKRNLSPLPSLAHVPRLPGCLCLKMHVTKLLCVCKGGVVGNNEQQLGWK